MRGLGEITGPRGWRSAKKDEPLHNHYVEGYGHYAFVWVVYKGEAKSAIHNNRGFFINGEKVDVDWFMAYEESEETRPKLPSEV